MKVAVHPVAPDGTEVVLVAGVNTLWHLPVGGTDEQMERRTLCGLSGPVYAYGPPFRERHACAVCAKSAPKGLLRKPRKPQAKRRGSRCRITEPQLRALYALHWEQRVPVNELGRRYWQRFGYKSAVACGNTISHHFRTRGWKVHDRIEMTVLASTKHGMKRRSSKSAPYKRFQAEQKGEQYDAPCTATTRKGKPCRVRAVLGKDVCQFHDAERQGKWLDLCSAMRAKSPLHDPARLEPAAPVRELLIGYFASGGRWRDLASATGIPEHWLSHVAKGKQERVDRGRAQAIRDALSAGRFAVPLTDERKVA